MTLNDVINGIMPAWRGYTSGLTLGTHRYPAAAAMVLADKAVGDGKLTYEQALAEIRAQDAADMEEHPYARAGGEVAGTVLNSAGGAGGALRVAGRTALAGGVQGFTGREGMENAGQDTLTGAAVGGALGAAAAGGQKALVNFAKSRYVAQKQAVIDKAAGAADDFVAGNTPLARFIQNLPDRIRPKTPEEVKAFIARAAQTNAGKGLKKGMPTSAQEELRTLYSGMDAAKKLSMLAGKSGDDALRQIRNPLKSDAIAFTKETTRLAGQLTPGIATGAAAGGAINYFRGEDPLEGAKVGAATVGLPLLLRKPDLAVRAAGALSSRVPTAPVPETAARLGTNAFNRAMVAAQAPAAPVAELPEPTGSYETKYPWGDEAPEAEAPAASGPTKGTYTTKYPWGDE